MSVVSEKIRSIANHYGFDNQAEKTLEELGELHEAIKIYQSEGMTIKAKTALVDEIADVLIMCRQLEYLLGHKLISGRIEYKLTRQLQRIANEQNERRDLKNESCDTRDRLEG